MGCGAGAIAGCPYGVCTVPPYAGWPYDGWGAGAICCGPGATAGCDDGPVGSTNPIGGSALDEGTTTAPWTTTGTGWLGAVALELGVDPSPGECMPGGAHSASPVSGLISLTSPHSVCQFGCVLSIHAENEAYLRVGGGAGPQPWEGLGRAGR